jgi:sugar phosphate isomerase/epimerase
MPPPIDRLPLIGVTSQLIHASKWYKEVTQFGVRAVEINRRHSQLHFNLHFLQKIRVYLEDVDLSLHSATTGILQDLDSFTDAELATLRAEVAMCRFLGARELVFHLNGHSLDAESKRRIDEIIVFARDQGVQMLYESDSMAQGHVTHDVLEHFPDIGYVLDIGHLNTALGRGLLGCSIDEFLRQICHRLVYIHASNNCGTMDEHRGLDDGILDWRRVFDRLDMRRIRKVIIEVRSPEFVAASKRALDDYFARQRARQVIPHGRKQDFPESACADPGFLRSPVNERTTSWRG